MDSSPTRMELLAVWERAREQGPVDRAITLLGAAYPGESRHDLASLRLGDRDARLLQFRQEVFGPSLSGVVACPACSTQLEFFLDVPGLLGDGLAVIDHQRLNLVIGDVSVQLRPLDSNDLCAAASCADDATARRLLCARCVVSSITPEELSDEAVSAISTALAAADPMAELLVELQCGCCARRSNFPVDIASFLWKEVDHLARNLLRDVHALAWAYGWREADILAMSDARRRFYLEAVS